MATDPVKTPEAPPSDTQPKVTSVSTAKIIEPAKRTGPLDKFLSSSSQKKQTSEASTMGATAPKTPVIPQPAATSSAVPLDQSEETAARPATFDEAIDLVHQIHKVTFLLVTFVLNYRYMHCSPEA